MNNFATIFTQTTILIIKNLTDNLFPNKSLKP